MAKLNNTISLEHEVGTLWPLCECQAMTGSRGTKIQMERDDGGCICLIDTATYCECHEQLVRGRTHSWPLRASLICVEMSEGTPEAMTLHHPMSTKTMEGADQEAAWKKSWGWLVAPTGAH